MVKRYSVENYRKRGTKVLKSIPKGWRKIRTATTHPSGYSWYSNGKSRFGPDYKHALVMDKK